MAAMCVNLIKHDTKYTKTKEIEIKQEILINYASKDPEILSIRNTLPFLSLPLFLNLFDNL